MSAEDDRTALIAGEMRSSFADLHKRLDIFDTKMDRYREESIKTATELRLHVDSCDRRYKEVLAASQKKKESTVTGLVHIKKPAKDWLVEKLKDKFFDYVIYLIILAVVFAFAHGFKITPP